MERHNNLVAVERTIKYLSGRERSQSFRERTLTILFDMGVAAVFGPGTVISEAAQDIIKIMLKGFLKK